MNYSDRAHFALQAMTRPPNPPSINIKTCGGKVGLLAKQGTHFDLLRTPKQCLRTVFHRESVQAVTLVGRWLLRISVMTPIIL